MRLIDADALKETIASNVYPVADYFNSRDYGMFWTGGIEKAIDEQPTVDAVPVKHTHWVIERGETVMHCNSCGWAFEYYGGLEEEWNYCPHCGSKMKEVEDEID